MRQHHRPLTLNVWGTRLVIFGLLLVLVLGLVTSQPAMPTYAVGTLDQQQTAQSSFALIDSTSGYAQTFTAGITGDLDQVDLAIANVGAASTITIQILSVVAGVPVTSPALSSTTVASTSLPTFLGSPVPIGSFPLSTSVPVVAGTQYAVAVRTGSTGVLIGGIALVDSYATGAYFVEIPANTFSVVPSADAAFRTYVTPPPTATPTPTVTQTPTPSSTSTATPTGTLPATSTVTATTSVTPTATATGTATLAAVNDPNNKDDEKPKQTEEQRQQHQHTNDGNRDDVYTEGNVVEVHLDQVPPYIVLANRDGPVTVRLLCGSQCPVIRVGDYVEVDGEKQNEQLFDATDISVSRNR